MRLIDADKLYPDCMSKKGLAITQSQIANAPTVDVKSFASVTFDKEQLEQIVRDRVIEPIKNGELVVKAEERPQGEWKEHYGLYVCSECGQIIGEYKKNFCATCGADMRGSKA